MRVSTIVTLLTLAGACEWSRVHNATLSDPIRSVYIRAGCANTTGNGQQLEMIFAEQLKLSPDFTNIDTEIKKNRWLYGFKKNSKWNYIRVFAAKYDNRLCEPGYGITDSNDLVWKCFITGSVEVKSIGKSMLYMNLILPAGQTSEIYLIRGMRGCGVPLESLSFRDSIKCSNVSKACGEYCKVTEMAGNKSPPLAKFLVAMPPLPASLPAVEASAGDGGQGEQCRSHSVIGYWNMESWESPYACRIDYSKDEIAQHLAGLCVVGDSHVIRALTYLRDLYRNTYRLGNYVFNPDIREPLKGQNWHPNTASMVDSLSLCASLMEDGGAVVWFYGSHSSMLSPAEMVRTLEVGGNRTILNNACTLVVGIPVSPYEGMSLSTFGSLMKYYQNPWRQKAQNDAMRRATERTPNYHYIDIYYESLALYYDGHVSGDPVHMPQKFYQYMAKVIVTSAARICGR